MLWMAPAAAAVAKDRGGIAIIAIRILHKRERERERVHRYFRVCCVTAIVQFK